MSPDIVIGLLAGVPALLLMVLRINASIVFLSVCLGAVVVRFVSADAVSFVNMFMAHGTTLSKSVVEIGLLLLPVLITMLFMIKTVPTKKLLFNLLPSLGAGLLLLLLIEPLLSPGLAHNIVASPLWKQLVRAQDLVVGISSLICLFFLLLQRPKNPENHKKHH